MKKKILLFAALSLVSCSDDDSKKEDKYYVDLVTVDTGNGTTQTLDFDYNDKNQLVKITSTSGTSATITYDGKRIKTIQDYSLTYQDGILVKMADDYQDYNVVYTKSENKYVFSELEVILNKYNDIIKMNTSVSSVEYDTSKKGPFYSLNVQDQFLMGILLNIQQFFLTSRAVTTYAGFPIINTYDANGYLIKAELAGESSVTYTYIKL